MPAVELGFALSLLGIFLLFLIIDMIVRMPKIGKLYSRYVLITGCDTGFGYRLALRLDKMGCFVFAGCFTEKGETDLRKNASNKLKTFALDVTKDASVRKGYDFVKANLPEGKGLWAVVNNAGIGGSAAPIECLTMDDYRKCCDINLFGLVDVTYTFLPFVKKEKGRIVNMASMLGRFSLPGATPYCIAKYGVEAFSDSIRRQLRPFGVGVHIIEPGFHKTNIVNVKDLEEQLRKAWQQAPQETRDEYGEDWLEESIKQHIYKESERWQENLDGPVDAYEHALTAMFPRARYVVGSDAKFFIIPLTYLPEWISDLIFDAVTHMPVPAACR